MDCPVGSGVALAAPREGAVLGTADSVNVAGIVPQLYSVGLSGADSEVLIKEFSGLSSGDTK